MHNLTQACLTILKGSTTKKYLFLLWAVFTFPVLADNPVLVKPVDLNLQRQLGQALFFDVNLSEPAGQACASCHDPARAFTDPDTHLPVSEGVHTGRFGNRNTPTLMYANFTPNFHYDREQDLYVGGLFLDGRALNLTEQAKGPLLNTLEMANPDAATVVAKVRQADYADLLRQMYGGEIFSDNAKAFQAIAEALVAFENSPEFAPFTSKYDYYLAGKTTLSQQEEQGLAVFEAEDKGNCAACHPSRPAQNGTPPLFTDYTYDNIGVPKNEKSPFLKLSNPYNPAGKAYIDGGLGDAEQVKKATERGKFKVPTLRNIALTAPYMHNGIFTQLDEVLAFYNRRDKDNKWGKPEVPENVNREELGDLKLEQTELNALEAFLRTLTDGYILPENKSTLVQLTD